MDGHLTFIYGTILVLLYLVYYILLYYEERIEDTLLRIFGFKESNVYNSYFLLTQIRNEANFLKIKSTLERNKDVVNASINEY